MVLLGSSVYYFLNQYLHLHFYKRLETRCKIAAQYYLETDSLKSEAFKTIREQYFEKLPNEKEAVISMPAQPQLSRIASRYQLPEAFLKETYKEGRANYRDHNNTFYAGINYTHLGRLYTVVVSAESYYEEQQLSYLRTVLLVAIMLVALLVLYVSFYFSKHIFDPVKNITDQVKIISSDNMHLRVNKSTNNNEITGLVNTFNDLLDRLETAFGAQRNFISNASHELATPLTAIIGEADVALRKERDSAFYQNAIKNMLQQAERLNEITKSLFFLAQTGYEGRKITMERIRTDELLWEIKEIINGLHPNNQVYIDLGLAPEDPKKLKIKGNRQLLILALSNIVNNACKYSYNKPVTVSIGASDNQVMIVIRDQGIGIPESDIPHIYDPFFRASNTQLFEGYGIGLPLSRNIINLHQGTLVVTSVVNEGTEVQISFPNYYFT